MSAYFDSGVLVKLYCLEADTPEAVKLVERSRPPLALTQWQEIEIRNALRLKLFRDEVTASELKKALNGLQTDLLTGLLQRVLYDITAVFRMANELSEDHASSLGCRTLDIFHVAAAKVIGADEFVTFDARQAALALNAGLTVRK